VFDDADFQLALEGAVASEIPARRRTVACICANRIYVQRGIAGRFVPSFIEAVKRLKVARASSRAAQIGPLINEETRRRCTRWSRTRSSTARSS